MERLRLSGLWIGKTKSGEVYFSGSLNSSIKLLVFKNSYKQGDNDPDYVAYLTPGKPQGAGDEARPSPASQKSRQF
jgi:hypothetical protein